jgi:hypothetical protein
MIDITTIQTFSIAPSLKALQDSNELLAKENSNLKNVVIAFLVIGGLYVVYKVIKKNEKKQLNLKKENK